MVHAPNFEQRPIEINGELSASSLPSQYPAVCVIRNRPDFVENLNSEPELKQMNIPGCDTSSHGRPDVSFPRIKRPCVCALAPKKYSPFLSLRKMYFSFSTLNFVCSHLSFWKVKPVDTFPTHSHGSAFAAVKSIEKSTVANIVNFITLFPQSRN
jgi:hypothetical protein